MKNKFLEMENKIQELILELEETKKNERKTKRLNSSPRSGFSLNKFSGDFKDIYNQLENEKKQMSDEISKLNREINKLKIAYKSLEMIH